MKRLPLLAILFFASPIFAQDPPPLVIDGGNSKIVQVDQVTIVKVDKLVVQTFPFTIKAPPGAFDYRWSFPPAISALDMGDSLQIQKGPMGDVTVGVVIKTIDFEAKKVNSRFQQISFAIGTPTPVPPPVPPVPPVPPAPVDVFTKAVQDAFTLESDPKKADNLVQLAALYKSADTTVDDPALKTIGALKDRLHTAANSLIGETALPKVRRAIANELNTQIGTNPSSVLDATTRANIKDEFHRIATTLGGIK